MDLVLTFVSGTAAIYLGGKAAQALGLGVPAMSIQSAAVLAAATAVAKLALDTVLATVTTAAGEKKT